MIFKYFSTLIQLNTLQRQARNTFQKSWGRGKKRPGKLRNAQNTPVWNTAQMNRLIGNRWVPWMCIKGAFRKAQLFTSKDGVHHFVNSCVSKQSYSLRTVFCQHTITSYLGLSSSTVYNTINGFSEFGENSACKRQGRKPRLNARDLQSHWRHCIKTYIILSRILPHGLRNTSKNNCQLTQFVSTSTSVS